MFYDINVQGLIRVIAPNEDEAIKAAKDNFYSERPDVEDGYFFDVQNFGEEDIEFINPPDNPEKPQNTPL